MNKQTILFTQFIVEHNFLLKMPFHVRVFTSACIFWGFYVKQRHISEASLSAIQTDFLSGPKSVFTPFLLISFFLECLSYLSSPPLLLSVWATCLGVFYFYLFFCSLSSGLECVPSCRCQPVFQFECVYLSGKLSEDIRAQEQQLRMAGAWIWDPLVCLGPESRISEDEKMCQKMKVKLMRKNDPSINLPCEFTNLCLYAVTGCSACWVMESCRRARCGRPWPSPPTISWTTWWPSWTSTVWVRVTRLRCSTTWRNTSAGVRLLGEEGG